MVQAHNKLYKQTVALVVSKTERGGGGGEGREVITDCCARCVQDRAHNRLLHLLCPRQREREGGRGERS